MSNFQTHYIDYSGPLIVVHPVLPGKDSYNTRKFAIPYSAQRDVQEAIVVNPETPINPPPLEDIVCYDSTGTIVLTNPAGTLIDHYS